jgi:hypothetical protein
VYGVGRPEDASGETSGETLTDMCGDVVVIRPVVGPPVDNGQSRPRTGRRWGLRRTTPATADL